MAQDGLTLTWAHSGAPFSPQNRPAGLWPRSASKQHPDFGPPDRPRAGAASTAQRLHQSHQMPSPPPDAEAGAGPAAAWEHHHLIAKVPLHTPQAGHWPQPIEANTALSPRW